MWLETYQNMLTFEGLCIKINQLKNTFGTPIVSILIYFTTKWVRQGLKKNEKIVEFSTKGLTPPPLVEKKLEM